MSLFDEYTKLLALECPSNRPLGFELDQNNKWTHGPVTQQYVVQQHNCQNVYNCYNCKTPSNHSLIKGWLQLFVGVPTLR